MKKSNVCTEILRRKRKQTVLQNSSFRCFHDPLLYTLASHLQNGIFSNKSKRKAVPKALYQIQERSMHRRHIIHSTKRYTDDLKLPYLEREACTFPFFPWQAASTGYKIDNEITINHPAKGTATSQIFDMEDSTENPVKQKYAQPEVSIHVMLDYNRSKDKTEDQLHAEKEAENLDTYEESNNPNPFLSRPMFLSDDRIANFNEMLWYGKQNWFQKFRRWFYSRVTVYCLTMFWPGWTLNTEDLVMLGHNSFIQLTKAIFTLPTENYKKTKNIGSENGNDKNVSDQSSTTEEVDIEKFSKDIEALVDGKPLEQEQKKVSESMDILLAIPELNVPKVELSFVDEFSRKSELGLKENIVDQGKYMAMKFQKLDEYKKVLESEASIIEQELKHKKFKEKSKNIKTNNEDEDQNNGEIDKETKENEAPEVESHNKIFSKSFDSNQGDFIVSEEAMQIAEKRLNTEDIISTPILGDICETRLTAMYSEALKTFVEKGFKIKLDIKEIEDIYISDFRLIFGPHRGSEFPARHSIISEQGAVFFHPLAPTKDFPNIREVTPILGTSNGENAGRSKDFFEESGRNFRSYITSTGLTDSIEFWLNDQDLFRKAHCTLQIEYTIKTKERFMVKASDENTDDHEANELLQGTDMETENELYRNFVKRVNTVTDRSDHTKDPLTSIPDDLYESVSHTLRLETAFCVSTLDMVESKWRIVDFDSLLDGNLPHFNLK